MTTTSTAPEQRPSTRLERATAFVLGIAAIGIAWAGFEANLWNGQAHEGYSSANRLTTQATRLGSHASAALFHDFEVDALAKEKTVEALEESEGPMRARLFHSVSYLYAAQLSEHAYRALGLPPGFRGGDLKQLEAIPEAELVKAAGKHFDESYSNAMLKEADTMMAEAGSRYANARVTGGSGDHYALVEVIFAISLFFGGISIVFRDRLSELCLGLAGLAAVLGYGYVAWLPWAWL